jgi:uncharacterized membrane protein YeaQ/YmgE (transglycosylase-associated protein family)
MKGFGDFVSSALVVWTIFNLIGAFLVGWIARKIFPAKARVGWPTLIVIGFAGGLLGKLVFRILGWPTGIVLGFVASVLGAFVVLCGHQLWLAMKAKKEKKESAAS